MKEMKFRDRVVNYIDVPASPKDGFNFPFKLIIPDNLCDNPDLLYVCNLPKDYSDKCDTIEELIEHTKKDMGTIDPVHEYLSFNMGNPMIVPFVPRFKNFRPNFLGRDCFLNKFKLTKWDNKNLEKFLPLYYNLADQHKAMIEYAIKILRSENINVSDKVIISGYSEGAKFASHLALLHPEIFKAVIAGGTGGVISMPVKEINGYKFNYPTGIADYTDFNMEEYQKIAFFYYMADHDKSDSAMPKFNPYHYKNELGEDCVLKDECGNKTVYIDEFGKQHFILDENGNYMASNGLFSDDEVNAINKALGTITQDRFKKQEEIYAGLGLNATFKLYPGNHRTIFNNCDIIFSDINLFINNLNDKQYSRKEI